MTTCLSSGDVPRTLRGYACWLQHKHGGHWFTLCPLRPNDARDVLRWLDQHPTATTVRVLIDNVG